MKVMPESPKSAAAPDEQRDEFVSLQEIVHTARQKLPQALSDHLSGGADSETTLRRNRLALERMLELLEIEIRTALGLMGVTSIAQLNPSWVRPARVAGPISATSAYPWYEAQR